MLAEHDESAVQRLRAVLKIGGGDVFRTSPKWAAFSVMFTRTLLRQKAESPHPFVGVRSVSEIAF